MIPDSGGVCLLAEGARGRKRQLRLPGCLGLSLPPPAHTRPLTPELAPPPWARPGEAPPHRAHAGSAAPHPTCDRGAARGSPQTHALRHGVGHSSLHCTHHPGANERPPRGRTPPELGGDAAERGVSRRRRLSAGGRGHAKPGPGAPLGRLGPVGLRLKGSASSSLPDPGPVHHVPAPALTPAAPPLSAGSSPPAALPASTT